MCRPLPRSPAIAAQPTLGDRRISATLYFLKCPTKPEQEDHVAGSLTEVTDSNFQAEVIESETPVLVDFWAPWCGPCRVIAPELEELDAERSDLRVVKLNIDENQQTAQQFEVLSIPTLILFKNGQVATKVIGAKPKKKIVAELEPALAA